MIQSAGEPVHGGKFQTGVSQLSKFMLPPLFETFCWHYIFHLEDIFKYNEAYRVKMKYMILFYDFYVKNYYHLLYMFAG